MLTIKDIYEVFVALVPLYFALLLAYSSVRWWNVFSPEQCAGINRFVAMFSIPFLSFNFIASNNIYTMNLKFLAADTLQKIVILFALLLWKAVSKNGSLEWMITFFSLCSLPNTLVMGVPLLRAMYGEYSASLMVQIVVTQGVVWKTLLLVLLEYREAVQLISDKFPDRASSINSVSVDSDVVSLNRDDQTLHADAELQNDGKVHVTVRKSSASNKDSLRINSATSDLHGIEIYSVNSSQESTPITSSCNHSGDFLSMYSKHRYTQTFPLDDFTLPESCNPTENSRVSMSEKPLKKAGKIYSVAEMDPPKADSAHRQETNTCIDMHELDKAARNARDIGGHKEVDQVKEEHGENKQQKPPTWVMTKLVLIMVWRKFVTNLNTYASLLGLAWSLIAFKWEIHMPRIVKESILMLSKTGLGMSMFSLGLFMAVQPKIINCRKSIAVFSLVVRFLIGPVVMAATSYAVGIRGVILHVAIVQAALPQAIYSFVFAKEYNVHAAILSTAVCFGMLVSLPVMILYHVLLEL